VFRSFVVVSHNGPFCFGFGVFRVLRTLLLLLFLSPLFVLLNAFQLEIRFGSHTYSYFSLYSNTVICILFIFFWGSRLIRADFHLMTILCHKQANFSWWISYGWIFKLGFSIDQDLLSICFG
jgi:hypothetical protein